MTTDLDKLEAVTKAATPGKWYVRRIPGYCTDEIHTDHPDFQQKAHGNFIASVDHADGHQIQKFTNDSAFIAAANPQTVQELIDAARERDALRAEVERLRGQDLAAQLRALAERHGWNFVWAKARQIEDGTKTCHKCHGNALTHSSLCVHYDMPSNPDPFPSRPSWDEAPEWAMASALDQDGEWCWYEYKPRPLETIFGAGSKRCIAFKGRRASPDERSRWRDSLQFRPGKEGE